MFLVEIPEQTLFDDETCEFVYIKKESFQIEHSLVSLSKWESKWEKPFLSKEAKTTEELLDYIRCMTITQNVNPEVYKNLPNKTLEQIQEYMDSKQTATRINDDKSKNSRDIVTAEVIYHWMFAQNIPLDCQKWHFNRLITLINVCAIKNSPPKKRGKREAASHRAALNKANRAKYKTKG